MPAVFSRFEPSGPSLCTNELALREDWVTPVSTYAAPSAAERRSAQAAALEMYGVLKVAAKDKGVDEARRELASRPPQRHRRARRRSRRQHLSPRAAPLQGPPRGAFFLRQPEQQPPHAPPPCHVSPVAHAGRR